MLRTCPRSADFPRANRALSLAPTNGETAAELRRLLPLSVGAEPLVSAAVFPRLPVNSTRKSSAEHRRETREHFKMSAIDSILSYTRKEEEDFYALLGCDENSTTEQIVAEYKVRALQYHPDKNEGDKEAEAKFQQLQEAKEILCDPEKRSNYDKWRNSGIAISYKQWVGMKEHVHSSMHWTTLKTKDRMLPETAGEGGSTSGSGSAPQAHRRASEGGANIHWGARGTVNWKSDASSEVVSKFRNYEI